MFKGIIQELGKVKEISPKDGNLVITIEAKEILQDKKIGDSISVDGVCQTIIDVTKDSFTVEAMPETWKKTILNDYKVKQKVNLEDALKFGETIDGHLVQGHVDAMGKIIEVVKEKRSKIIKISFPEELSQYLALKGSITVNGVSLTIMDLQTDYFGVALIPHTLDNTNLSDLKVGDKVNLEIDVIARYVERMMRDQSKQTKYEWLSERNFI